MKSNISIYHPMMNFMAEMVGLNCEIVLYDVENKIVEYVINPFDEDMVVGSEIRSLENSFLENNIYHNQQYIVNYRALSKTNRKLKSGTYFFKNPQGELDAIMTVNVDVDQLVNFRDLLNKLVCGDTPKEEQTFYNSFDISVEGFVIQNIVEELSHYPVEVSRLSQKEKMDIVHKLDKKGLFLVKGAISELASALNTTETTIYRYLKILD